MREQASGIGAVVLLVVVVIACAVLVGMDKIDGPLFVGAIVGPIVGGSIGYAAGTKGVQQGSQASTTPPPVA